jgi:hypothetical protein
VSLASWRSEKLLSLAGQHVCQLPRWLAREKGTQDPVYRPKRPQRTVLYSVVQDYLETWPALQREDDPWEARVPGFVECDFRKYLACGILAHGSARARCKVYLK